MADYITVGYGCRPWSPDPEAELRKVLHRYTIPLTGIIRQHNVDYLFWCLIGEADESNVWAYTHLQEGEASGLMEAPRGEVVDHLRKVTVGRGCVLAFAYDEAGIVLSATSDTGITYADPGSIGAALDVLSEQLKRTNQEFGAKREPIPA